VRTDARSVISAVAAAHPHVLTWLEPLVMAGFTVLFVLYAFLFFKPEHVEHHPTRVLIGAALQGFIIGMLVGFVIMPLRIAFFVPDPNLFPDLPPPPSKGLASLSVLPAFVMLIVIRQGLLARAPLIGRYLRAYRRAAIKHQVDGMRRALARLEAVDARVKAEDRI
jgi:hypothetical protein